MKMYSSGLILATGLLLVCWTTSVSSRSLNVASENNDLDSINIPSALEFEGGDGDLEVGGDNVRDKRTPRLIFRTVSCLFTFLVNPNCLQGITGGGSGGSGGSSSSSFGSNSNSNRRQQSQPYYMISLPRYNDSDSNGTATEYPIYPIESTSEYPEEQPSRPTNPILAMIRWKMNLIPNLLRRFIPGFGGGRRDDGSSGSPFAGFNLGSLGFGSGGLSRLFGGGGGGGGGGRGFGGLGLGGGLAGLGGGLGGGGGGLGDALGGQY